jgi:hypothetical protein
MRVWSIPIAIRVRKGRSTHTSVLFAFRAKGEEKASRVMSVFFFRPEQTQKGVDLDLRRARTDAFREKTK